MRVRRRCWTYHRKNTVLKGTRAPDHGNADILETVLPSSEKRGLKTICRLEDVYRSDIPHIDQLQEIDLHGRHSHTPCFNNPNYRNFLRSLVEDYATSCDIDGLMWGSEWHVRRKAPEMLFWLPSRPEHRV